MPAVANGQARLMLADPAPQNGNGRHMHTVAETNRQHRQTLLQSRLFHASTRTAGQYGAQAMRLHLAHLLHQLQFLPADIIGGLGEQPKRAHVETSILSRSNNKAENTTTNTP
jgi:hypothetical protein